MELISIIALGILGLVGAALSRLMADEFKAWLPTVINHLIGWAISLLPEDQRERYADEWRSDIDRTPGEIGKLIFALDLVRGAWRLSRMSPEPTAREIDEAQLIEAVRHLARCQVNQLLEDPLFLEDPLVILPNAEAPCVEAVSHVARYRAELRFLISNSAITSDDVERLTTEIEDAISIEISRVQPRRLP